MGPPHSKHSHTQLEAFATYFHDDDDEKPGTAESSQSSVNIEQMSSEQFMAVYTAKLQEEAANPGRQVHVANCDVGRSAYITTAPPPINDHNCHAYSTRREMSPSLIRSMMSSSIKLPTPAAPPDASIIIDGPNFLL